MSSVGSLECRLPKGFLGVEENPTYCLWIFLGVEENPKNQLWVFLEVVDNLMNRPVLGAKGLYGTFF